MIKLLFCVKWKSGSKLYNMLIERKNKKGIT